MTESFLKMTHPLLIKSSLITGLILGTTYNAGVVFAGESVMAAHEQAAHEPAVREETDRNPGSRELALDRLAKLKMIQRKMDVIRNELRPHAEEILGNEIGERDLNEWMENHQSDDDIEADEGVRQNIAAYKRLEADMEQILASMARSAAFNGLHDKPDAAVAMADDDDVVKADKRTEKSRERLHGLVLSLSEKKAEIARLEDDDIVPSEKLTEDVQKIERSILDLLSRNNGSNVLREDTDGDT